MTVDMCEKAKENCVCACVNICACMCMRSCMDAHIIFCMHPHVRIHSWPFSVHSIIIDQWLNLQRVEDVGVQSNKSNGRVAKKNLDSKCEIC